MGSGAHQQSGSQQGAETGKPLPKKGLTEGKGYDEAQRHHTDCVVTRKFPRLLTANQGGGRNPPSPLFLYFRLKNQRQEGFINTYPPPKKPGIFYICVPLKGANAQDVAAFCVTAREGKNCLWESIARGPALINRGAARG